MTSRDSRIIIYEQPSVRHRGGRRQEASSFILNILNIFTFEQTRRRCFCLYLKLYTHTHTHGPPSSIHPHAVGTCTHRETRKTTYVRTHAGVVDEGTNFYPPGRQWCVHRSVNRWYGGTVLYVVATGDRYVV